MDFLKSLGNIFGAGQIQGSGSEQNILDSLQGLIEIDPEIIDKINEIEDQVLDLTGRANDIIDMVNKYGKLAAFVFALMFLMIAVLMIVSIVQMVKINKLEQKIDDLGKKPENAINSDNMNGLQ